MSLCTILPWNIPNALNVQDEQNWSCSPCTYVSWEKIICWTLHPEPKIARQQRLPKIFSDSTRQSHPTCFSKTKLSGSLSRLSRNASSCDSGLRLRSNRRNMYVQWHSQKTYPRKRFGAIHILTNFVYGFEKNTKPNRQRMGALHSHSHTRTHTHAQSIHGPTDPACQLKHI